MLKTKKYDEEHEIHFAKSLVKLVKINEKIEGYYVEHKLVILNGSRFDQILCFSKHDRTKRKNGIRSVLCL